MDKGYYDYDYKEPSEDWVIVQESANSDDELAAQLAKMGLKPRPKKPLTAEEMQRIAMEENEKRDLKL